MPKSLQIYRANQKSPQLLSTTQINPAIQFIACTQQWIAACTLRKLIVYSAQNISIVLNEFAISSDIHKLFAHQSMIFISSSNGLYSFG